MNIFIRNLSPSALEADLNAAFGTHGTVRSSAVIKDRQTGASRGFGFVEMLDQAEAEAAIERLNGRELQGRVVLVRPARSLTERIERAYRRAESAGAPPPES